jgi:hypothetical protein
MSRQRATLIIEAILRKQRLERRYAVTIERDALLDQWCAWWADPDGHPCGFCVPDLAVLCDRLENLTDQASILVEPPE